MARRTVTARAGLVLAGALAAAVLGACGSAGSTPAAPSAAPAPSAPPAPDPTVKPYCDAVVRVQAEQASPQAGQGGVPAASATARRQIASLVATAPPEIAGDWQVLQGLTDRSLGVLAATGGDPRRIDQKALDAINRQAQPTTAHIKAVTEKRCGVAFSAAGPAPAARPAPATPSSSPTSTSKSSRTRTSSPSTSRSSSSGG